MKVRLSGGFGADLRGVLGQRQHLERGIFALFRRLLHLGHLGFVSSHVQSLDFVQLSFFLLKPAVLFSSLNQHLVHAPFYSKFWWLLVVYSMAVLILQYLWGFAFTDNVSSRANELLGLNPDSHDNFWVQSRWHLGIFVLASLQYFIYGAAKERHLKLMDLSSSHMQRRIVVLNPSLAAANSATTVHEPVYVDAAPTGTAPPSAHYQQSYRRPQLPSPELSVVHEEDGSTVPASASLVDTPSAQEHSQGGGAGATSLAPNNTRSVILPPESLADVASPSTARPAGVAGSQARAGAAADTSRPEASQQSWFAIVLRICYDMFVFLNLLVLLLAGFLGNNVSALKIAYVVAFDLNLLTVNYNRSVQLILWFLTSVVAAVILVLEYIYQFERLQSRIEDGVGENYTTDLGLRNTDSQGELFAYLIPATAVLVLSVIYVRILSRKISHQSPSVSVLLLCFGSTREREKKEARETERNKGN